MSQLALEVKLYRLLSGMLLKMVEGISDDDFHALPAGGGNSPNWILGHLTVANLMGIVTLGGRPQGLKKMLPVYGPGSTPTEDVSALLSKADLIDAFKETADQLAGAAEAATADQLASLRDNPILREELPTAGDIVGHLLTTHIGIHTGQLSAWRRGRGMASIVQI